MQARYVSGNRYLYFNVPARRERVCVYAYVCVYVCVWRHFHFHLRTELVLSNISLSLLCDNGVDNTLRLMDFCRRKPDSIF